MTSRIRALDGIRGLALVAVLGYHALPGTVRGGFLGVDVFFVLSGFLLTSLLLDERDRTGGIDRRRYAARRARRLVPGGLVLLLALALFGPLLAPDGAHRLGADVLSSAAGLTNWHLIADGASYFSRSGRPPLVRHFWSLAIEVQFYVICPFVVAWLARRRRRVAIGVLLSAMAASALAMWLLYRAPDPYRAYYGTDARIGALLAGVLAAVLLREETAKRSFAWLAGPAAVVVGVLFFIADERSRLLYPEGFVVTQAATMSLIAAAMGTGVTAMLFRARPLRWLGERSYGIYLWHWPIVVLLRPGIDVSWPPVATAAVTIGLAVVIGAVSYRFVESPFMRGLPRAHLPATQRRRLVMSWAAAAAVLTLITGLVVRLPAADPIAESLSEGEQVLAAQAPPVENAAPVVGTPVTTDSVQTTSTKPVARAAPRPVAVRPLIARVKPVAVQTSAMGDSVMLGAAKALRERLGPSSFIDAKKNRQFREGSAVAREMKAKGRMGPVAIVHLGNNGPAKQSDLDRLLGELKHARTVLLLTVRVPKPWQDSINAMLAATARKQPKTKLVDWYGYSNGHRDWFWKDGTHLRPEGAKQYAKLIASAVPPPPKPKPTATPSPEPTPTPGLIPPLKP